MNRSLDILPVASEHLAPELRLVVGASAPTPSERCEDDIRRLAATPLDWSLVMNEALHRQHVLPLVYRTLTGVCPEAVPPSALARLHTAFLDNARHNTILADKMLGILALLERNGVMAVPFKGPALTAALYGDLALRQFGDLDVLVHPRHVSHATALLEADGYQLAAGVVANVRYRAHYSQAFSRADLDAIPQTVPRPVVLELHWRFVSPYFSFGMDLDVAWPRLGTVLLSGAPVRALAPDDLVIVLCVHGAKHGWKRLKWVCDIAQLLDVHRRMDWDAVMRKASSFGAMRMLLLGVYLARDLLGARVPREIERTFTRDAELVPIADRVKEQYLFTPDGALPRTPTQLLHLAMRERLRDRVRYCRRGSVSPAVTHAMLPRMARVYLRLAFAFTPNEQDWAVLPLPRWLSGTYFLLRPLRLLGSRVIPRLREWIGHAMDRRKSEI